MDLEKVGSFSLHNGGGFVLLKYSLNTWKMVLGNVPKREVISQ